MLLGADDTDSPKGGCTTHFALLAAGAFQREHGLVLRALPRLVRLNPNIPWKTRGNAAVALDLGVPSKSPMRTAGVAPEGTPLQLDPHASQVSPERKHAETLDGLIEKWCDLSQDGTDPAYLLSDAAPPAALYENAVKGVVLPADVRASLAAMRPAPIWKALGDGRGIVGAAAAAAYPAVDTTFEIIVYRKPPQWGTPRKVGFDSVDRMDREFPSTYHNIDRVNRHVAIAPSTPCPLLFGIRAFSPDELEEAAGSVEAGEAWGGWMLFETNQGTDAHLVDGTIPAALPLTTVRLTGTVTRRPRRLKGGHVVVTIADGDAASLDCVAFEPTKQFRDVVGILEVGDRVQAVGAIREGRRSLNLEKLEIITTVPRQLRGANPPCPSCGRRMKSAGSAAPFRCRQCGTKIAKEGAPTRAPPPGPRIGWHEVPISARRHLARPIDPHGYRNEP